MLMSTADTQTSTQMDVRALEQCARELDAEIAQHVPTEIMRKINRRIIIARLIEAHANLKTFERQCATVGA